jgi:hypothetical protein
MKLMKAHWCDATLTEYDAYCVVQLGISRDSPNTNFILFWKYKYKKKKRPRQCCLCWHLHSSSFTNESKSAFRGQSGRTGDSEMARDIIDKDKDDPVLYLALRHEDTFGGTAPRILNRDIRRKWVVSFTTRPLYPSTSEADKWAPKPV